MAIHINDRKWLGTGFVNTYMVDNISDIASLPVTGILPTSQAIVIGSLDFYIFNGTEWIKTVWA